MVPAVTPPAGCVLGVDVSAAQPSIDWARAYVAGVRVAIVEIGIGNDKPNPCRAAQVASARAAGLTVLGYDFAYPLPADGVHAARDPQSQARLHLAEAKGLGLAGLFLDVEWPQTTDWGKWGVSADYVRAWTLAWLATMGASGVEAGIYGAPSFLRAIQADRDPALAAHPLWLADWGASTPDVPEPWDTWQAWQYSDAGRVDGIPEPVDLTWVRSSASRSS